jgi:chorismate dehydratase
MQPYPSAPLRLGHIVYSNCFPVHGRLVDRPMPGDPVLIEGLPSRLNDMLDRGEIHVAPSSSIEYARHPDRYRILPDLAIGARGPVRSILLLSTHHPRELRGLRVGLPSASATSVVLLKILLRIRWEAEPELFWFDQAREDPFARGAAAALFIGDVALRPGLHPHLPIRLDLGAEWMAETGLPFAFAVWQATAGSDADLRRLHSILMESRRYCAENRQALAERHAARFGLPPELLDSYWADLQYDLDEPMIEGLREFYRLAAETGEIPAEPELRWV